uniref:Uncharacterized protein n=1 Tax=Oryza nivara TaxID=4536 RepID=A0A0E0JA76_ORYNI
MASARLCPRSTSPLRMTPSAASSNAVDPTTTFPTLLQQVGLSAKKRLATSRWVWESRERYTLEVFRAKVAEFESTMHDAPPKNPTHLQLEALFLGGLCLQDLQRRVRQQHAQLRLRLLQPPLCPGWCACSARLAVVRLVHTLGEGAQASKARMRANGEPEYLVDYWMQETVREIDEAKAVRKPPPMQTISPLCRIFSPLSFPFIPAR